MRSLWGGLLEVRPRSRFGRNWSLLAVSSVGTQTLGMLATIRIARVLAPAGYGQYNLVLVMAGLGAVLASLGFRNVVIRECARHPEASASVLLKGAGLRAVSLAVVGTGLFFYSRVGEGALSGGMIAVAVGLLLALSTWDLVESVAFGFERMEYTAGINLAGNVLWVGVAWSVPQTWITPINVSLAFAVLQGGEAVVYFLLAARGHLFRGNPQSTTWRSLVGQSAPFYWLALLTAATGQLPILLLAQRSGPAQVGLYNAGYRMVSPLQMASATALAALYPALSRQSGKSDDEQFMATVHGALLGITLLGTGGALVISILRTEIVGILFGQAYRATADALAFQCWYVVLLAIFTLIGTELAARDRQKWLAGLSTAYTLIALPILWLGAGTGATGLAIAMVVAGLVNMTYHWVVFQRSLPRPVSGLFTLRLVLIAGAGMLLALTIPQAWALWTRALVSLLVLAAICGYGLSRGSLTGMVADMNVVHDSRAPL